jgi:hypothetical protein
VPMARPDRAPFALHRTPARRGAAVFATALTT